ncbi:MAG: potassium/proton antiporter [Arcobacter sp.]|jgi:cell volume regulation protein A|uniref:Potassium:proton antiporter n=1 Tax=Arcobacter defluvii TaxID=873191 RepID=A0AAE7E7S6_9BACT|nr:MULTISPECIES: potassium/proton antiporter [Arcobacter]MDY3201168.1 potassium/proton antiporter [Arcobacter sp.]QKF77944.1 potassium:proton antiporter [Arcobacter defluvii]RXI32722.1 potassium/proton antiporter [Arcobacter defluvii]BAK73710.1 potassium-proton antiporter [Arcobacter sp. L]
MASIEFYLLITAFLMLLSVVASKLSSNFGIPSLFIFLGLGMLAGSDGILGIHFDNVELAQHIGTLALIFILFGGGLDTAWKSIKPVLKDGLILATVGVFLTAFFVAICVYYILGFTFLESLLVGAIISSTDAAAVFAILRAKGISLKKKLTPLLELESGSNDPMAIFLTVAILQILMLPESSSITEWILRFFLQFIIGGALGYIFGILLPPILNRIHLSFYGLYPVFTIGWILFLFSSTSLLEGNGFLAVYLAGIVANTKEFVHKKNLIGFHEGLSWIMQITVFLALGLLVFPSELPDIALSGLLIAFCLMFIARPAGVFISTIFSSFTIKEKAFISWVGLRGAVPIILATYPYLQGFDKSNLIFNIVFFIVLFSILIQGTTLPLMAKWLNVESKSKDFKPDNVIASPLFYHTLKQFYIEENSKVIGLSIVELNLPADFLILLIKRENDYLKPTGSTILEENDMLLIQCNSENRYKKVLKRFKP